MRPAIVLGTDSQRFCTTCGACPVEPVYALRELGNTRFNGCLKCASQQLHLTRSEVQYQALQAGQVGVSPWLGGYLSRAQDMIGLVQLYVLTHGEGKADWECPREVLEALSEAQEWLAKASALLREGVGVPLERKPVRMDALAIIWFQNEVARCYALARETYDLTETR